MKHTNETIEIEVSSPLLRPGLILRARASKRYAGDVALDLLDIARSVNRPVEANDNHKAEERVA